jgi:hypothetical protein
MTQRAVRALCGSLGFTSFMVARTYVAGEGWRTLLAAIAFAFLPMVFARSRRRGAKSKKGDADALSHS